MINSETIVSFAIEKIISLTVSNSFKEEIEKKIPSKCYTFMTDIINNLLKLEYLPYDRDDKIMPSLDLDNLNNEEINIKKEVLETISKNKISDESELSLSGTDKLSDVRNSSGIGFLKINESWENVDNKFFDNFFYGINNWTICDEPVIK